MIFSIIATVFLLAGMALFYFSSNFKIDAAPVGSVMIVVGAALFIASVFLYGVSVGTVVGSLLS